MASSRRPDVCQPRLTLRQNAEDTRGDRGTHSQFFNEGFAGPSPQADAGKQRAKAFSGQFDAPLGTTRGGGGGNPSPQSERLSQRAAVKAAATGDRGWVGAATPQRGIRRPRGTLRQPRPGEETVASTRDAPAHTSCAHSKVQASDQLEAAADCGRGERQQSARVPSGRPGR